MSTAPNGTPGSHNTPGGIGGADGAGSAAGGGSDRELFSQGAPPSGAEAPEHQPGAALNLAGRPFVNSRPVARATLILWLAGLLLLAANFSLFLRYLENSQETRTRLGRAEAATDREKRAAAQASSRLDGLDLEKQNQEVAYLNEKIAERTFSWSLLFDRLATKMPDGVRLLRLTPSSLDKDAKGQSRTSTASTAARGGPGGQPPVQLSISAQAKNNEAALLFVQRLFEPPFMEPDLKRKELGDDQLVKLEITVQYGPAPNAKALASPRPADLASPARPSRRGPGILTPARGGTASATAELSAAPGGASPDLASLAPLPPLPTSADGHSALPAKPTSSRQPRPAQRLASGAPGARQAGATAAPPDGGTDGGVAPAMPENTAAGTSPLPPVMKFPPFGTPGVPVNPRFRRNLAPPPSQPTDPPRVSR